MRKAKRIPKFKTIAEEAKFWDTHDVMDFLAEMKEVKVNFKLNAPRKEVLAVRIQPGLKQTLERIAKSCGINVSTLARIWLIERLRASKESNFVYK